MKEDVLRSTRLFSKPTALVQSKFINGANDDLRKKMNKERDRRKQLEDEIAALQKQLGASRDQIEELKADKNKSN